MDDNQVIEQARAEGFELEWRPVTGKWCVGFVRGDDPRYPVFGDLLHDRLVTTRRVFA